LRIILPSSLGLCLLCAILFLGGCGFDGSGADLDDAANVEHARPQIVVRVVVMTDDSDPKSFPRLANINKNVTSSLEGKLKLSGFEVVDEETAAIAAQLPIGERRPKSELIALARAANRSKNANAHARMLVIYRLHVEEQELGISKLLVLRMDGEMYDIHNATFVGGLKKTRERRLRVSVDCSDDCIEKEVDGDARSMAQSLGEALVDRMLAHLAASSGLTTSYNIHFRGFSPAELSRIQETMRNDFTSGGTMELQNRRLTFSRYKYVTLKPIKDLDDNFRALLKGMGYRSGKDISITFRGDRLEVEKLD